MHSPLYSHANFLILGKIRHMILLLIFMLIIRRPSIILKFAEFFETPELVNGKVLFNQWMSEDGGRLHLKRNKGMIVEIDDSVDLPKMSSSYKWMTLYQIKCLIKENSWVSPHIRSIISHL